MIDTQDITSKNEWWQAENYKVAEVGWEKRDLYSEIIDNIQYPFILNIVGLRRVGKSTILKQIIGHLLNTGVKSQNIFYYLFDYASQLQKAEFLDETLSVYFQEILKKPKYSKDEKIYILLDEVQYIENWQSVLKRHYDLSDKHIKFIVTGSQSILLRGKHQESLAGRIFDFYLPPMSFREFLRIRQPEKIKIFNKYDLFDLPRMSGDLGGYDGYYGQNISQFAKEYITIGQFPEMKIIDRIEKQHEYIIESVLGKVMNDCIQLFNIEKTDEFKIITRQLLNNIGSIFELKNLGQEVGLSFLTLTKYVEYLKDSYAVEILYKYHKSPIKQGRILKKLYTPCVNFTCALNHFRADHLNEVPQAFGKVIENAVYNVLALKYKGNKITDAVSFWRQGEKEIDFLVNKDGTPLPIEVKFSDNIGSKNLRAMTELMREKKIGYGVVATKSEYAKKQINGQILYYIPYYLILLMI